MAYFIKQTKRSNGDIYLQIYESYYSKEKKTSFNKSIKKLGLLSKLKNKDESDSECIKRLSIEAKELERRNKVIEKIDDNEQVINLGYFLPKAISNSLGIKKEFDLLAFDRKFKFSLFKLLSDLSLARIVTPCSKRKTINDIFPSMYNLNPVTRDQVYDGLAFLGENYKDAIEVINEGIEKIHRIDLSKVYFDCTNFFFEIDYPDEFRKPGPSKENRPNPLVGMGLMLDSDCIPIAAEFYPGNKSEKPYLPKLVDEVQRRAKSKKIKVIEVADKGLNCVDNIVVSKARGNGYIFSKSMKMMKEEETKWAFDSEGWVDVLDENKNLKYRYKELITPVDYSYTSIDGKRITLKFNEKRVVSFNPSLRRKQLIEIGKLEEKARNASISTIKKDDMGPSCKYAKAESIDRETGESTSKDIVITVDESKLANDRKLAGYNMLVTSEIKMSAVDIYNTYHHLSEIEHTFRVMKSQLDARPIFVSKEDSIKGHLLTIYYAVVLLRLIEKVILKDNFSLEEIVDYIQQFEIIKWNDNSYRNLLLKRQAKIGDYLEEYYSLNVNNKRLDDKDIDNLLSIKYEKHLK